MTDTADRLGANRPGADQLDPRHIASGLPDYGTTHTTFICSEGHAWTQPKALRAPTGCPIGRTLHHDPDGVTVSPVGRTRSGRN